MGSFQYKKTTLGLRNAPALFSRAMRKTLGDLPETNNYLDDVVIASKTWISHLAAIRRALQRFLDCGLKLKPSKCEFVKSKLELLGFLVSKDGICPDPAKVEKIYNCPQPNSLR